MINHFSLSHIPTTQNCIDQRYDDQVVAVARNNIFRDEFSHSLRIILAGIDAVVGEPAERAHREGMVGLAGLIVFAFELFRDVDGKLIKVSLCVGEAQSDWHVPWWLLF